MTDAIELSIVMPCLNEAETLAGCIRQARLGLERSGVDGEILSLTMAAQMTRCKSPKNSRYASCLWRKRAMAMLCEAAFWRRAEIIVMGDADESYDFLEAGNFVEKFREGFDFVGLPPARGGGKILPGRCRFHIAGSGTLCFRGWRGVCLPRLFTMFIAGCGDSRRNYMSARTLVRRNGIRHGNDH